MTKKDPVNLLLTRIKEKEALIGIIGLGYVGLPLVKEFHRVGFHVTGFDIDSKKVAMLKKGKSYIKHITSDVVRNLIKDGRFKATTDFANLKFMDCIIICVPTPLTKYREPDLSFVFNTTMFIAKYLRKGQLIILESTTYPGTTDEDMKKILEGTGLMAGKDFYLAYSPEREDPANKEFTTSNIPKVVGGYTRDCLKIAKALYDSIIIRTVPVSSTKIAEATKLLENIYRGVNIALVNEMKMLFDRMGIDIWEVIEASKTKPFGFQAFYPGPGLGGHCIPIDPFYLTWKAREYDFPTRFIELAGEINTSMPHYIVDKVMDVLNERGKSIKGSSILVLGLAYKKDVGDVRESPSLEIIERLREKGAKVDYNDPFVQKTHKMRHYDFKMFSVPLTEQNLKKYDCTLILTDHTSYDYDFIAKHSRLIVDTRNAMKGISGSNRRKIIKA
ncbi:MAG: UDP-N-acetyl-D-glucosamine dehydrogenase [Nitrospirae bacterium RBG_13_39_12]|nr:MAG: UDP-N-acetyl-D-glucosamine dehydrogenase [Nitrospirae bacterium RBG_13_39_12]